MTRLDLVVTSEDTSSAQLPDWLSGYVVVAQWLDEYGVFKVLELDYQLQRKSGAYQTIDAVIFLLAYFLSGLHCGFKEFARRTRPFGPRLAALAGRSRWITQGSLSRLLDSADKERVEAVVSYLLVKACNLQALVDFDQLGFVDAIQQRWHILHWDPTIMALRQRALPEADDLPRACRRTDAVAKPGYAGRKRGDVVVSRSTLQDGHTSAWLGVDVCPGNAEVRQMLHNDLGGVDTFLKRTGGQKERTMVVVDGAWGGTPQLELLDERGLCGLARLSEYGLLELVEVAQMLEEARWQRVEDSLSGPQRWATELGQWQLTGEFSVRVVISRFELSEQAKRGSGAGKNLGGWHYEIFGTLADKQRWPAADLVELYYGRNAHENRYGAERKELRLDQLYSQNPSGQKLVCAVALWVWNLQLVLGSKLVDKSQKLGRECKARCQDSIKLEPPPVARPKPKSTGSIRVQSQASGAKRRAVRPQKPRPKPGTQRLELKGDDRHALLKAVFDAADFDADWWRERNPGWQWDAHALRPRCPAGQVLELQQTRIRKPSQMEVRYRGSSRICTTCPLRAECSKSTAKVFRRETSILLRLSRLAPDALQNAFEQTGRKLRYHTTTPRRRSELTLAARRHQLPSLKAQGSALVAAELRKAFRLRCQSIRCEMTLKTHASAEPRPPAYFAPTAALRQKRRHTFEQRARWNRLHHHTRLELRMISSCAMLPWLPQEVRADG